MPTRRRLAALALAILAEPASAQTTHFADLVKGVAVGGNDPVAYFTEGKPVKGSPVIIAEFDGVV